MKNLDTTKRREAMKIRNRISNAMTYFEYYGGTGCELAKKALNLWEHIFRIVILGGRYDKS